KPLAVAALICTLAAVAGGFWWMNRASGALRPDDTQIVARGKTVYQGYCAVCHGANLQGQPNWQDPLANGRMPAPPHSVEGHTRHHDDALLVDLTTRGTQAVVGGTYKSDMPGFETQLSKDDIYAVLSYIKSTWPQQARDYNDTVNRNAQAGK
ncbi:MAG: cytochrome c, partial [Hyphomicrobiales bacterium]